MGAFVAAVVLLLGAAPSSGAAKTAAGQRREGAVATLNPNSYPPLGVPIDTMADNGKAIQIGSYSHAFAVCRINAVVVNRTTLAVVFAHNFQQGIGRPTSLIATINKLVSPGAAGSHPLVILASVHGCPFLPEPGWNKVLAKIGGVALPVSGGALHSGWSVIGTWGFPSGTAYENGGRQQRSSPVRGEMNGYLQRDYVGPFTFVPPKRIAVDLNVGGATSAPNTISVGGASYSSGSLACGSGGFQVVTLNAVTLAKLSGETVATNGCGAGLDAQNVKSLIGYLDGVANSPGGTTTKALVLIQSIGAPRDKSIQSSWQALDTAVAGVGGTQTVLASDTGSYSLIGSVGIGSFPLAEGSSTATPEQPAHVTAVLKRVQSYVYEPQLSANSGSFSFGLTTLAYQAPQQWPSLPGEQAALEYISTTVLHLPVPTPQTAGSFCYVPPTGQLDVRYAFCDPALQSNWLGSQYANDLAAAPSQYNGGLPFTKQQLQATINLLLPQTGYGEFAEVSQVWTDIDELAAAMGTKGQVAFAIANSEAATIHHALKARLQGSSVGFWFDLIGNTLNIVGALFPAYDAVTGPVNLLAAGMYLAEDTADAPDGSPALGHFSVTAANFEQALVNHYQEAAAQLYHVLGLIVTDPGKLQSFYQNATAYSYVPTAQSNQAFQDGAAAFAWETLLPSAYELVYLPRINHNKTVTNADNYRCTFETLSMYAHYRPFKGAADSAQLLNSKLYVLVKNGSTLPNGYGGEGHTPPASLTDPLFEPFAISNGAISGYGLYQPWFYRSAYGAATPPTVHCRH